MIEAMRDKEEEGYGPVRRTLAEAHEQLEALAADLDRFYGELHSVIRPPEEMKGSEIMAVAAPSRSALADQLDGLVQTLRRQRDALADVRGRLDL